MFLKPYRLKSKTALKNSEKKHLVERLEDLYPHISHEELKELIPVKSFTNRLKIVLSNDSVINLYSVDSTPMFFETDERLFPTVYALWKVPNLVPMITTFNIVVTKIQNGAQLYLPGVIIPPQGIGFPHFSIGDIIAVNTEDNSAAACVGIALMSTGDMLLKGGGACMDPVQFVNDQLSKESKYSRLERPKLSPSMTSSDKQLESVQNDLKEMKIQPKIKEEWPALGGPRHIKSKQDIIQENKEIIQESREINKENISQTSIIVLSDDIESPSQSSTDILLSDMDGLLKFCLLSFLKKEGKKIVLPLKTNLLYRNHMLPYCPPDHTLDVKKSSYKKMSKFLEAMEFEGLLQVRQLEKGVDAVTTVNLAHPSLKSHEIPDAVLIRLEEAGQSEASDPDRYTPPVIKEMFSITAAVLPLFSNYKKGQTLSTVEIRTIITEYIKNKSLQDHQNKSKIKIDLLLGQLTGRNDYCSWEQLMNGVIGKMTHCTELHYSDGTVKTLKSKLDPIRMQVATRSGNKKVTLVSNLESYGIDLTSLSKYCRTAISVSSSVTKTPGAKFDQLLVQGDQTHLVTKMLIERFGLPKKYIEGADKNLSKKK